MSEFDVIDTEKTVNVRFKVSVNNNKTALE